MAIILHDLAVKDDRRPSPFCWRIKYVLAYKGLEFETRPVRFVDIPKLGGGAFTTVPVLEDGSHVVGDSWAIADDLDERYPEKKLFQTPAERGMARFFEAWLFANVYPIVFRMYVKDIHDHVLPEDQAYFRESREKRLGSTLEAISANREERVDAARESFAPMRLTFVHQKQAFLAGDAPGYVDFMAAGTLLWLASIATLPLFRVDDPVVAWFGRMQDLYGGLGRAHPLYSIVE